MEPTMAPMMMLVTVIPEAGGDGSQLNTRTALVWSITQGNSKTGQQDMAEGERGREDAEEEWW